MLRYPVLLALIYAAFALACTQLPLVNTLGYEFAMVMGLVVAFGGGVYLFPVAKQWILRGPGSVWFAFFRFIRVQIALLLLPAGIMVIHARFVPNCSILTGGLLFLMIPVITVCFVTALAILATVSLKKWGAAGYYLILLLFLSQPFAEVYLQPHIFSYNHIFGVFIGLSWDESQPLIRTLAMFRATSLVYTAGILGIAEILRLKRNPITPFGSRDSRSATSFSSGGSKASLFWSRIAAGVALSCLIIAGSMFQAQLGFVTTKDYTCNELGTVYRTDNFDIWYSKKAFDKNEIILLAQEHEFRLQQVARSLQIQWNQRITSYIYPDSDTKKRLLGTESSELARPWAREIHLSARWWRESLKHELVHVLASGFAPYVFKAPGLRTLGLTEGLAMAVEWEYGNRTLHQYAAALQAYNMLPRAGTFMSTIGFIANNSSASYVAGGSFCKWLMDSRGIDIVKKAYLLDDIESATGMTYHDLDSSWRGFLQAVPREVPDSMATAYGFRSPSLLKKLCMRTIADMNKRAAEAADSGQYRLSLKLYRESAELWSSPRAVFGMALALYRLKRFDSLHQLTSLYVRNAPGYASFLPMYFWRAEAAWKKGEMTEADSCYNILVRQRAAGWFTDEAERRLYTLRSEVLRDPMRAVYDKNIIPASNRDSVRAVTCLELRLLLRRYPNENILRLELAGRLADKPGTAADAVPVLNACGSGPFQRECLVLLGDVYYELGQAEKARTEYSRALLLSKHETDRNMAQDKIERCIWKMNISGRN